MKRHSLVALALILAVGCDETYTARLDDGAGLSEGSRVMVSGVHVGEVRSVRVIEGRVDVELELDSDHDVTLRQDACAMASRDERGPFLVVQPGTGAMRDEDDESPIPQCRIETPQLGDMLRSLSEEMGSMLDQIGRGIFGPPPDRPPPQTGTSDPLPPPPGCLRVHFRLDRIEGVSAIPLHLPDGGHRVWLEVTNDNAHPMTLGALSDASFVDADGRALTPVPLPSEPEGWLLPFDVPAGATRRVSVVFAGDAPRLARVEVHRTRPTDDPSAQCTIRQDGLGAAQ